MSRSLNRNPSCLIIVNKEWMQRAKFGDEGEGGRRPRRREQQPCSCKFSAISCSRPPSFLRSFLASFLPSHLSPLSKLEPGSLLLPRSLVVQHGDHYCIEDGARAVRRRRLLLHASSVFFVDPVAQEPQLRTNERPTFKEEDRNRSIGNLSKVYLPQAVKGTSTA